MLIFLIALICLFALYYVFAEYRIYTVTQQRDYWNRKFMDTLEIPFNPDDYDASKITP